MDFGVSLARFLLACNKVYDMKRISIILTFFSSLSFAFSQEITVKPENKTISGTEYVGFISSVEGSFDNHKDLWIKEMKNKGKVKKSNSYYKIEDFVFPQITEKLLTGCTQVALQRDSTVSIWLGIDVSTLEQDEASKVEEEVKGIVYNYILDYRKSAVLKDIEDAERAAAFTSRKHQKLISELETLQLKLLDAQNEKTRLEESIKSIEFEINVLQQKIENNKTDQETTYKQLEQIRKVLEMHKERLKKLN